MTAGGYKFADFLRVGIPLTRITSYNVCYTKLLRCEAAVFIAVGITDHDGLPLVAPFEVRPVDVDFEQRFDDAGTVVEVLDRLEQRRDVEGSYNFV